MTELKWRKSTYSADYNCVEVAVTPEVAAIRDSKARDAGHCTVSATGWRAFLARVRAGTYDRRGVATPGE